MSDENEHLIGTGTSEPSSLQKICMDIKQNLFTVITPLLIGGILISYFFVFFIVIPPVIQAAIDGNESILQSIHLRSIEPVLVDISLLIPLAKPAGVDASITIGKMTMATDDDGLIKRIPLFQCELPMINVKSEDQNVSVNGTLAITDFNYSWGSWFLFRGLKHGFSLQDFLLSAIPRVHIPALMGTWPANLKRSYTLDPNSTLNIDLNLFNISISNVSVDQKTDQKGQLYYIADLDLSFSNPSIFSLALTDLGLEFWIYYKKQPIIHISTLLQSQLLLTQGSNTQKIQAKTKPEYTVELMELIGRVSDGIPCQVVVTDLQFIGNAKWSKMQDMIERLSIEYEIPSMDLNNLFNLIK